MKLVIDYDRCIMAGECCYNHPDLFEFGDDDYPRILVGELSTEAQRRGAEQAAAVCPSGAISVSG